MSKKKIKKKSKFPLFLVLIVIIAVAGAYVMFFTFPSGDNIKKSMEKDDFVTLFDIDSQIMLPEGATRSLTFTKTLNGELEMIIVVYFSDADSAKAYYAELDEPEEDEAAFLRGNTVIMGTKEATTDLRWKIWAF